MKLFLIKTTLFTLLIAAIYCIASFITYRKTDTVDYSDYMEAIIDKHERLETIKEPKLIFVGGSNLAFGINSSKIEKEIKRPVVNLGLHAGLGLSFMLEEIKYSCREGDVVFLSIEYFLSLDGDYELKQLTRKSYQDASRFYHINPFKGLEAHIENSRKNIKTFSFARMNEPEKTNPGDSIYRRVGFNEHGDFISHLEKVQPKSLFGKQVFEYRYWEGIKALNEFSEYAKHNNITTFFLYPNYPRSEYEANKENILKYAHDLSQDLKIEILNNPEDFVFDDSLFYDTVYHLNASGREKRTDKLIQIVSNLFNGAGR